MNWLKKRFLIEYKKEALQNKSVLFLLSIRTSEETLKFDKVKNTLSIKFHSMPIYEEKYIKARVREFNGVIKTNSLGDKVPKENVHYTCITCITIDSVMKMEKKNYPQVYLEEYKYKIKKIKMTKFIDTELESESELESDFEKL